VAQPKYLWTKVTNKNDTAKDTQSRFLNPRGLVFQSPIQSKKLYLSFLKDSALHSHQPALGPWTSQLNQTSTYLNTRI
jgi:hypothetical protein